MLAQGIYWMILIGAAGSAISSAIVFGHPFEWLRDITKRWQFTAKLLRCPFCVNYWTTAAIVTYAAITQFVGNVFTIVILWCAGAAVAHIFTLAAVTLLLKIKQK